MSAPLPPPGKLVAPVEKVVGEKRQTAIRKTRKRRPSNISSAQTVGPYLEHAPTDLGGGRTQRRMKLLAMMELMT